MVGLLFVSAHLRAGPFRALKMRPVRQVLLLARHASENASGGQVLLLARHASENASRAPGGLFEHGTHIPYHRRPSPVPNAQRQVAAAAEPGVHFSRPLFVLQVSLQCR